MVQLFSVLYIAVAQPSSCFHHPALLHSFCPSLSFCSLLYILPSWKWGAQLPHMLLSRVCLFYQVFNNVKRKPWKQGNEVWYLGKLCNNKFITSNNTITILVLLLLLLLVLIVPVVQLLAFVAGNLRTLLWWCLRRFICWWEFFQRSLVPKPINHWPQWHPLALRLKPDSSNQRLVLEDPSQTIRCFRPPQAICHHHPWDQHHLQWGSRLWRLHRSRWQPFSLLLPDPQHHQLLLPMALLQCLDSLRSSCLDWMSNSAADEVVWWMQLLPFPSAPLSLEQSASSVNIQPLIV